MTEKRPFDILNASLDNSVLIRLKGGVEVRGKMASYDVHMNLVLEGAEHLENGEVKRKLGKMLSGGGCLVVLLLVVAIPVETAGSKTVPYSGWRC